MVITLGSISIVVFGWCISPLQSWLDRMIEHAAKAVLVGIGKGGTDKSTASSKHLLHAKMLVGLLACHTVIAIGAALALRESSLSGSGWSYWDCYYFTFVTCSSIGFGDYALGPTDDTHASLVRLLWQAVAIFVGMTFFNSSAGTGGDWANAILSDVIAPFKKHNVASDRVAQVDHSPAEPVSVFSKPVDSNKSARDTSPSASSIATVSLEASPSSSSDTASLQASPPVERRHGWTQEAVVAKKPSFLMRVMTQKRSFKKFGGRNRHRNASSSQLFSGWGLALYVAQAIRRLMVFYVVLLVGGLIFSAIEAGPEVEAAQALRDEENQIRLLAGMPLLGSLTPPPTVEARSDATVRAELVAIGGIPDPAAQDAAIAGVVQSFVSVVDHEQGCDQLADMTYRMLESCKSQPPDPISLCWTFNGAVFFMLTVMTTIGYGTFAPATDMGKLVVVAYGTIAMTLFGISLGVVGNCVEGLVEMLAAKVVLVFQIIEAKVAPRPTAYVSSRNGARTLHSKMLVSLAVLHVTMAIFAGIAQAASTYFNGSPWEFFHCYYFAFATFSTIGFGDFAMGPTDTSALQLLIIHLQAILIFFGLAAFNTFATVAADWLPEMLSWFCQVASMREMRASPKVLPASDDDSSTQGKEPEAQQAKAADLTASSSAKTCASSAASLLFRILRAILCAYVILLIGALLLYWTESQNEVRQACASRAEENRARASMRLPPKPDDMCI